MNTSAAGTHLHAVDGHLFSLGWVILWPTWWTLCAACLTLCFMLFMVSLICTQDITSGP